VHTDVSYLLTGAWTLLAHHSARNAHRAVITVLERGPRDPGAA